MFSAMSEDNKLEREVYLQERRDLIQAEAEQSRSFDKAILTLTAGALALSLTFAKDVVPTMSASTTWILQLSWGIFVLSLLLTLTSFQISASAIRRQREILDSEQASNRPVGQQINCPARWTGCLNWGSLIAFMVGAVMMTLFVALNL